MGVEKAGRGAMLLEVARPKLSGTAVDVAKGTGLKFVAWSVVDEERRRKKARRKKARREDWQDRID